MGSFAYFWHGVAAKHNQITHRFSVSQQEVEIEMRSLNLLSAAFSLLPLPLLLAVLDVYLDALGPELPAANVAEDGRHLLILLRAL